MLFKFSTRTAGLNKWCLPKDTDGHLDVLEVVFHHVEVAQACDKSGELLVESALGVLLKVAGHYAQLPVCLDEQVQVLLETVY